MESTMHSKHGHVQCSTCSKNRETIYMPHKLQIVNTVMTSRILLRFSSSYARQGITAVRIPEANANIEQRDCAMKSLSQVMAVNWINTSKEIINTKEHSKLVGLYPTDFTINRVSKFTSILDCLPQ